MSVYLTSNIWEFDFRFPYIETQRYGRILSASLNRIQIVVWYVSVIVWKISFIEFFIPIYRVFLFEYSVFLLLSSGICNLRGNACWYAIRAGHRPAVISPVDPEIHRDWELCRWEFSVGVDLVSARVCAHGLRQAKPLQKLGVVRVTQYSEYSNCLLRYFNKMWKIKQEFSLTCKSKCYATNQ